MRFRMLGPLEVLSADGWTGISAAKWRSLLACLLLKPGQIVPTETLIAELWGDAPPPTANNLVSIYVHRLRRLIDDSEGEILVHRRPGYLLRAGSDDTDLGVFEKLVGEARSVLADGDAAAAAAQLGEAENLWRGGLLADVAPTDLVTTEAERVRELHLAAAEMRIQADMECGRHREVVPELRSLTAGNPLREGLWLLLMRALDGAGRHAEALETYGQAREVIADELGVDPGPELRRLYADLLATDAPARVPTQRAPLSLAPEASPATGPARPSLETVQPAHRGAAASEPGDSTGLIVLGAVVDEAGQATERESSADPAAWATHLAQLPADIGDFTGRATQVTLLGQMLERGGATVGPGMVRIAVVAGAAGLGKTTLAVHAAHQVRGSFPDGQLYVDLTGASADPTPVGEALARFLRDLGVDGDKVPVRDDERAAMYRTRLTGRRVLILLDNARDAAQVRPLLPGTESCAVLVTTRNRMPDLVGTRFVDLNVLSDVEALELFTRIVGDGRPAAEPDATAEVLLACAGLPLAIRISAARLAARRQWKIATLASRLRDEHRRLDELQTGDMEVRASFQVSYDALRASRNQVDPRRVFRLLGLWQGRTISLKAATALIGEKEGHVAAALETLVDANLLESPAPDWYQFHDLLRVFATERAQEEDPQTERHESVRRLLRWYLRTAIAAADIVAPHRYRVPEPEMPMPDSPPASVTEALDWYELERANVVTATRQASRVGEHDVAWRLPAALFPIFNRRDNWADCITAHRIAMSSAREEGNLAGEAWASQNLGASLAWIREQESLGHLENALAIRKKIGDRDGEGQTAISLTDAYYKLQGAQVAFEHSQQSVEVLREVGNPSFLGIGLNNHGEICLELGRLDDAAECCREALDLWRTLGEYGQGHAMQTLGRVHLQSGRVAEAVSSLTEADRLHKATGDLMGQAVSLKYLGLAQREAGRDDHARQSWREALVIFQTLKADSEVAAIQAELAAGAA